MGSDGEAYVRQLQHKFMQMYHLTPATAPPVVRLNFGGAGGAIDGDAPFTLMP